MIEIKSIITGDVIFSSAVESIKDAAEKACQSGANLIGADLRGADLRGANLIDANLIGANLIDANLIGAYLRGSDLRGANLIDANLRDANLRDANLRDADLRGADLRGSDLIGADLIGANLIGAKIKESVIMKDDGVFQVTPIGSRESTLVAFNTESGIYIKTGCFFGSIEDFANASVKRHRDNKFGREYAAAIELVKVHFNYEVDK